MVMDSFSPYGIRSGPCSIDSENVMQYYKDILFGEKKTNIRIEKGVYLVYNAYL